MDRLGLRRGGRKPIFTEKYTYQTFYTNCFYLILTANGQVGITFSDKEAKGLSLLSTCVPWVSGIVRIWMQVCLAPEPFLFPL